MAKLRNCLFYIFVIVFYFLLAALSFSNIVYAADVDEESNQKKLNPLPPSIQDSHPSNHFEEGVTGIARQVQPNDNAAKKIGKTTKEPVQRFFWKAEKLIFRNGTIIAYGNVLVSRGSVEIRANHMVLYQKRKEVYAEGNVMMYESNQKSNRVLYADKLYYTGALLGVFKFGSVISPLLLRV